MSFISCLSLLLQNKWKTLFVGSLAGMSGYLYLLNWRKDQHKKDIVQLLKKQFSNKDQKALDVHCASLLYLLDGKIKDSLSIQKTIGETKAAQGTALVEAMEKLKVQAFVRLMTSIYSACLFFLFLRVKTAILNRYIFLDKLETIKNPRKPRKMISAALHEKYSENFHLFQNGIQTLLEKVKTATENVVSEFPLNTELPLGEVIQILKEIKSKFGKNVKEEEFFLDLGHWYEEILLPSEMDNPWKFQYRSTLVEDDKLQLLVNETRDVIESSQFVNMVSSAVSLAFDFLTKVLSPSFQQHNSLPIAKILPLLCRHSATLLSNQEEGGFVGELSKLPKLDEFFQKIFEAPLKESDVDITPEPSLHVQDVVFGAVQAWMGGKRLMV